LKAIRKRGAFLIPKEGRNKAQGDEMEQTEIIQTKLENNSFSYQKN